METSPVNKYIKSRCMYVQVNKHSNIQTDIHTINQASKQIFYYRDRYINISEERLASRQNIFKHTDKYPGIYPSRQADIQWSRQTNIQKYKYTGIYTSSQADIQRFRQTSRNTTIQTGIHQGKPKFKDPDRQTYRNTNIRASRYLKIYTNIEPFKNTERPRYGHSI